MYLEDYEKVPFSQKLCGLDLLKTLPPKTKLFDNVSLSESRTSEISGPFSDVVYSAEMESKRKAKELFGKDLYTAFSFSSEFRSAIEDIKTKIISDDPEYLKLENLIVEDFEKIKSGSFRKQCSDNNSSPKKYNFLQFPLIDHEVEDTTEKDVNEKKKDKEVKDKKKKSAKIWIEDDESIFDTMSGYWRLLSVFDEFKISPPWYDAYAEGKEHWLQTKPIPFDVIEQSRKKCLNWLSKYFND